MNLAARLFLEALRFDLQPEGEVRRQAERALALGAGGFVVFGGEAEQISRLTREWRDAVRHRLWIASDLERGPGQQFDGLAELPPPMGLAACPDSEAVTEEAGRITGRGAREIGVDLVLAPVLDLDVDPRNPIVGTRAFGSDGRTVGRLGRAWIEGCEAEGVGACAKHFPGHGRTTADSHDELPVVHAGRSELAEDLEPFARVIDEVTAIMTAHVAYPAFGSSRPATLEPRLLVELLREELGFEGLVVTDALNMGGFTAARRTDAPDRTPGSGAIGALLAGCDLLLYPDDLAASAAELERAALRDMRVGDRLEQSLGRLETAARRISRRRQRDADAGGGRAVAGSEGQDLERASRIAVSSVRVVGALPWRIRPAIPLRLATLWDDRPDPDRAPFGSRFAAVLRERGWTVEETPESLSTEFEDPADGTPTLLLLASTPQAWKGTAALTAAGRERLAAILARRPDVWPVVFGHPRLLDEIPGSDAGMCAWGTEETMETAAAQRLDLEFRRSGHGGPVATSA